MEFQLLHLYLLKFPHGSAVLFCVLSIIFPLLYVREFLIHLSSSGLVLSLAKSSLLMNL
jgi:hypothetical protein